MVDGQTWYIQEILHQLYEDGIKEFTEETINLTVDSIIQKCGIGFSDQYLSLTDNQSMLLRAISKEGKVESPLAQEFINKYNLPAVSSTRVALKALLKRQMLYKEEDGYIVYDRFYGMWLRRQ